MTAAETLATLVRAAPPSELPALAAELTRALATALSRIATAPTPPASAEADDEGRLLTVEEAAARLSVPKTWLYRHARNLPFAKKLGRRTLRFDPKGLDRWAATRPKQ